MARQDMVHQDMVPVMAVMVPEDMGQAIVVHIIGWA